MTDRTIEVNNMIKEQKRHGFSTKGISDGYHTFDELYEHRRVLTAVLAKSYPEYAWRSKLHSDGTMFDGCFNIGFNTPEGQYSYHYHLEFWGEFDGVKILERAPKYDGHNPSDIKRLTSMIDSNTDRYIDDEWVSYNNGTLRVSKGLHDTCHSAIDSAFSKGEFHPTYDLMGRLMSILLETRLGKLDIGMTHKLLTSDNKILEVRI